MVRIEKRASCYSVVYVGWKFKGRLGMHVCDSVFTASKLPSCKQFGLQFLILGLNLLLSWKKKLKTWENIFLVIFLKILFLSNLYTQCGTPTHVPEIKSHMFHWQPARCPWPKPFGLWSISIFFSQYNNKSCNFPFGISMLCLYFYVELIMMIIIGNTYIGLVTYHVPF